MKEYLEKARQVFEALCANVENDLNILAAKQIYRQINHVNSFVTALGNRSYGFSCQQKAQEPANKKIPPQRFMSTKKKVRKREPAERLTKPSHTERELLLNSLTGAISVEPAISSDHDYAAPSMP